MECDAIAAMRHLIGVLIAAFLPDLHHAFRIESTQMLECFFHIFSSGVAIYTMGWRLL